MNVGWVSEHITLSKKKKEIEGLSTSSFINLQAAILDAQQMARQTPREKLKNIETKNKGIEERVRKDLQNTEDVVDLNATSYQKLVEKAKFYEQFKRKQQLEQEEADWNTNVAMLQSSSKESSATRNSVLEQEEQHQQQVELFVPQQANQQPLNPILPMPILAKKESKNEKLECINKIKKVRWMRDKWIEQRAKK